jgi:KUP system potassium uptake protein
MATWRWGRKATFAAYQAKPTMTVAELIRLHRESKPLHGAHRGADGAQSLCGGQADRTPALLQLIWDRHGLLPRNLVFVEVKHPKVPYVHGNRFRRHRARSPSEAAAASCQRGSQLRVHGGAECRAGALQGMARHQEIALPTDRQRVDRACIEREFAARETHGPAAQNAIQPVPDVAIGVRPAYYAYGLGDEVQLSAEVMPVRLD